MVDEPVQNQSSPYSFQKSNADPDLQLLLKKAVDVGFGCAAKWGDGSSKGLLLFKSDGKIIGEYH